MNAAAANDAADIPAIMSDIRHMSRAVILGSSGSTPDDTS